MKRLEKRNRRLERRNRRLKRKAKKKDTVDLFPKGSSGVLNQEDSPSEGSSYVDPKHRRDKNRIVEVKTNCEAENLANPKRGETSKSTRSKIVSYTEQSDEDSERSRYRNHELSFLPEKAQGRKKKAATRRNDDQLQARLSRLEAMYKEAIGKLESKKLSEVMQEAGQSPLSDNLLRFPFPRKCSLPTFTAPFTGTGDAIEHLRMYRMTLTQWDHYDVVLCKFFPASLRDEALMWFKNFPKGSVKSFSHLSELFLETYIHNNRFRPEVDVLFQISRGPNESLRSLVTRWRKLCAEIGKVLEAYAILGFKNSLRKTDPIFVRMYETMPKNLGKLREIQEDYIALEELQDGTYDNSVKGTSREANVVEPQKPHMPCQGAGRSNNGSTQFDKHRNRGWKGRGQAQQKKEKFVNPVYTKLNTPISEILKQIDRKHKITYPWNKAPTSGGNITGRIHKLNFKGDEVFSVAKEPPIEEWLRIPISFSASEAPDGGRSHNDPLVFTMAITLPENEGEEERPKAFPWAMPKILIDGGSSAEILFYDTFKQMGFRDDCLIPSTYNIFGSNDSLTRPRGEVTLEIRVGKILTLTTFCVVDVLSPYTAIVGRSWVHGIKGVPSTYHQRLRLPTPDGVAEIIGDSGEAKYCYNMDVQNGENKVNSPKAQEKGARNANNLAEVHDYITITTDPKRSSDVPSSCGTVTSGSLTGSL
ncbi:uncharacterized protein LOC113359422 [Papaver somniferum]|uniref:uncharacterized protein LOC113359422 n=1 Tax=Papaver somniferum TaxID=3469 RepID=UPI000E70052A|nr:uncharacterized protein LOC113359422 [Papaver somniferum]